MDKTLGLLLLLPLLLTGCGEEGTGRAASPTPPADEPVVVSLVHATNAGGSVSDRLTPIGDDGLLDFLTQFDSSDLSEQVMLLAEDNPPAEGHELTAAVVAVGCDVPPGVRVTSSEEGWMIRPDKVTAPLRECLAPVTTVAVVDVPR